MVYFESPAAKVSWNEADKAVIFEWKGFAQGELYRTPINKLLELVVQKQSNKVLYDCRKMSATSQDDQKWLTEDWYARSIEAGIKYSAIVIPEKVIAKSIVNKIVSAVDSPNPSEEFDNIEEAVQWLSQVN